VKDAMVEAAECIMAEGPTNRGNDPPAFVDKLGTTMQFIRAAEQVNLRVMASCVKDYPHITSIVGTPNPETRSSPAMETLRQHAVELARKSLLDEMREFQNARPDMDDHQVGHIRERIHSRLRRLAPGASTSLSALRIDHDASDPALPQRGEVTTRPNRIAAELARHWGHVFGDAPIDAAALERWLHHALPPSEARPPTNASRWDIRKKDITRAIKCSGNSLPGPDRIPYAAWKKLGPLAVDILFDAAAAMARDDFPLRIREAYGAQAGEDHPFNLGLLVCIPKKPVANHPEHGEVYSAATTRPLAIVDTANRVLANAYRYRWEPTLAAWVSPEQRGFLPGRSILANVLDVEEAAAEYYLTDEDPAIFLFDFAAAFPSVHQTYLIRALQHIGLPPSAIAVVRALYDSCRCVVCFAGEKWPGFHQKVGIRQGCPLSPLLFAVVMDLFLRQLRKTGVRCVVRAYADDIAIVVRSIKEAVPILQRQFQELGRISNLQLNLPKSICIPRWHSTLPRARQTLGTLCPSWGGDASQQRREMPWLLYWAWPRGPCVAGGRGEDAST
jgi:hypothetical protein